MRLCRKPKSIILAQSQEEFDKQADQFLLEAGFPVDDEHRMLYGQFIQHSNENEDSFEPEAMAKRIRKARATMFAFYLIQPSRRPKPSSDENPSTVSE